MPGNYGVWGVFEQQLYRVRGDDDRGIGVFARAAYSSPDRSLLDFYADCGIEWIGPTDARPNDKVGMAIAYAHVSPKAQALDGDFRRFYSPSWPRRTSETMITAAYQYEIKPGLSLQPNLQYVVRPGGGATDPLSADAGRKLGNTAVVGLRAVVKF